MSVLTIDEISDTVRQLLKKYCAEYAILFGSYACGEATPDSDIDLVIVGGDRFVPRNVFAFAEDLRELLGKNADVFEIRELNIGTSLYETVMKTGIKIV